MSGRTRRLFWLVAAALALLVSCADAPKLRGQIGGLEKIAEQEVKVQNMSGAALSGLVVSGEVPLSPTIFDANITQAKQKGAPVEWRPLEPVVTTVASSGLVANAPHPHAALLFLETPSNPRLRITDIKAASALGHEAGALVAVDNTVLSPALQRPLELGADVTVSSLTKLINGHSDMIGGVLCAKDPDAVERHRWWANAAGTWLAAFDAFLGMRGLRTLPLRARAQSQTALELARRLDAHPKVKRVDYPGLETHPGHALARRQQSGFGPLLSIEIDGDARVFVQQLELFTLAQSLGGAESLVSIPALMTHAAMAPEARAKAGIADSLIRLSAGLEDMEDLWADLDAALSA
jgi:cystathionine gamma-synthase